VSPTQLSMNQDDAASRLVQAVHAISDPDAGDRVYGTVLQLKAEGMPRGDIKIVEWSFPLIALHLVRTYRSLIVIGCAVPLAGFG